MRASITRKIGSFMVPIATVLLIISLVLPWVNSYMGPKWASGSTMLSIMPGGLVGGFNSLVKGLTQVYETFTGQRGSATLTEAETSLFMLGLSQLLIIVAICAGLGATYYELVKSTRTETERTERENMVVYSIGPTFAASFLLYLLAAGQPQLGALVFLAGGILMFVAYIIHPDIYQPTARSPEISTSDSLRSQSFKKEALDTHSLDRKSRWICTNCGQRIYRTKEKPYRYYCPACGMDTTVHAE